MIKSLFLVACFLFLNLPVFAQVKINEFVIEPDQSVEVLNVGPASADISGWYIDDSGGTTYYTIPQNSILYPESCLVFSGSFNLNKTSMDSIRLFSNAFSPTDPGSVLIDAFAYPSSPGQNISYSRIPDGSDNWSTASATLNQFNESSQSCLFSETPTPSPTPSPTSTPTPTPTPRTSSNNIYIWEFMANPQTGEKEWVEIHNANDFQVELAEWYIDDIENAGSQPYIFSTTIGPGEYKVIELAATILNNTQDTVSLLDFDKKIKDSLEYVGSEKGKSWGRISFENKGVCLQEPSKGLINTSCLKLELGEDIEDQEDNQSIAPTTSYVTSQQQSNQRPIGSSTTGTSPGEVLGETISETKKSAISLHKFLSFLSLSYSSLTLASLFFRIKSGA